MESLIKSWNTDLNFWELNPLMKTIGEFKDLFNNDKSKNKVDSSKVMWAIALLIDPNENNVWRNVTEDEKKLLIKEDFLEDKKFFWEDPFIVKLIEKYIHHCLTHSEKELLIYEEKLIQRAKFIKETDFTLDYYAENDKGTISLKRGTADQLDKMLLNTKKIFDQVKETKAMIKLEADQGNLKGGAQESASEKGEL